MCGSKSSTYVYKMSVLVETSVGDIVIDLDVEQCPTLCENFLKLCKLKFYNFSPIYNICKDSVCQSGDPNYPQGDGGRSAKGVLANKQLFFEAKACGNHAKTGTVSMALVRAGSYAGSYDYSGDTKKEQDSNRSETLVAGSQFLISLGTRATNMNKQAAVFGQVVEGFDTLDLINTAATDDSGRPWKDIRIKHTYVLEDPFPDPEGFEEPAMSPGPSDLQLSLVRESENQEHAHDHSTPPIQDDQALDKKTLEEKSEDQSELDQEKAARQRRAQAQALTLEVIGDLPSADASPDANTLFVCKLNSITQDEDLELIFSRFGEIRSCRIVRDKDTGDSMQYGFIKFADRASCEKAYFKMQSALIDDRRIHVDFSQSVSKRNERARERSPQSRYLPRYPTRDRPRDGERRDWDRSRNKDRPSDGDRPRDWDRSRNRDRPRDGERPRDRDRTHDRYANRDRDRDRG